jgi:hypothetical protein
MASQVLHGDVEAGPSSAGQNSVGCRGRSKTVQVKTVQVESTAMVDLRGVQERCCMKFAGRAPMTRHDECQPSKIAVNVRLSHVSRVHGRLQGALSVQRRPLPFSAVRVAGKASKVGNEAGHDFRRASRCYAVTNGADGAKKRTDQPEPEPE